MHIGGEVDPPSYIYHMLNQLLFRINFPCMCIGVQKCFRNIFLVIQQRKIGTMGPFVQAINRISS